MKYLLIVLSLIMFGCDNCNVSSFKSAAAAPQESPDKQENGHDNFDYLMEELSYSEDGFWKYEDKNIICYFYFYAAKIKFEKCRWKIPSRIKLSGNVENAIIVPPEEKSKSWDEY
jgi:hypothetical protein